MSPRLCCSFQQQKNKSDVVFYACHVPNMTGIREVHTGRAVFNQGVVQILSPTKLSVCKPTLIVVSALNPISGNVREKSSGGIEEGKSVVITTRRNLDRRRIGQSAQLRFRFL